jgi:enamine deaminase RidA (YjgF/YER057c/UK114 family)
MPVEHRMVDGVPDVGVPHVSIATGSKMMFFCGQVGRRLDGTPAGDTVRAQFTQALHNLATAAEAVGVGPQHVVKSTVYVRDLQPGHLEEVMAAVGDYIEQGGTMVTLSASTMVGVTSLYEPWCLVEVDVIAVVD